MNNGKVTPCGRQKMKRDEKIWSLFVKWLPEYGRTEAYNKVAKTGVASMKTVINVVKRKEREREKVEF